VAEGVFWLRLPMPMALDHVNLWLLRDGDGWTVIDTGLDDPKCKEIWQSLLQDVIDPKKLNRIIVTHFHPDHIGLAGWLARQCDCKVLMTAGEYYYYRTILERNLEDVDKDLRRYFSELNFPRKAHDRMISFFSVDEKPPETRVTRDIVEFIKEGDCLEINGSNWQIICGAGHSPEHACLYNAEQQILISGDQAIPRISSNVSVYYGNRHTDPLGDWISSCEKLDRDIPADTLILPAHQEPFKDIQARMQQMIVDHHALLNRVRIAMQDDWLTVDKVRAVMFTRELSNLEIALATGEAQAHLSYLLHRNELIRKIDENGAAHYSLLAQQGLKRSA
ncbi:MAG: MBL fold metallo-hydrolase, partial [Pseudomonadota bacterium]